MKKILSICMIFFFTLSLSATEIDSAQFVNIDGAEKKDPEKQKKEKTKKEKKEKDAVRTGWTFGILPSVGYDADLGFQYGILSNVYYFGDGSKYPDYLHSFYVEAAYTTKRYGIFRFRYDSKYLIPKHHLQLDFSYLPDAMSDFLGYNGYQSVYNREWTNMYKNKKDKKENIISDEYLSRAFYKFKRDIFRIAGDIQGNIGGKWYWNAGLGLLMYNIGTVDIDMINKGKKDENKLLPAIDGLYEKYQNWGIINKNENGGWYPYVRAGITYDSRDRQQNPRKGIYTDLFLTYSAAFGEQKEYNNLKVNYTFRHYVPIYKDYINFSYRLACQLSTAGDAPFYANSYWNTLFIQRVLYEGLGGGNTLRGIMRNRILSNGFAFANVEFRFKLVSFNIKKENFYIGLVPFLDAGMILQPYKLEKADISALMNETDLSLINQYFDFDKKKIYLPHLSAGLGLKIVMNDNFVLSVDWAMPFNKQDNHSLANIYVKIGYMF